LVSWLLLIYSQFTLIGSLFFGCLALALALALKLQALALA